MKFISIAALAILSSIAFSLSINPELNHLHKRGFGSLADNLLSKVADDAANAIAAPRPPQGALDGAVPPGIPEPVQVGLDAASIWDDLPSDIKLRIFEQHFPEFSLADTQKMAIRNGISSEWAILHHDPSKDDYEIVKKWAKMSESAAKNELKEKMMLNPKLKNLFAIEPTRINFEKAIEEGNPEVVKYLIARGVKPTDKDLGTAIKKLNPRILKALIEGGVSGRNHLSSAISKGQSNIAKALIEGGVRPDRGHLAYAIRLRRSGIVEQLLKGGVADISLMNAIQLGNVKNVEALIKGGAKADASHLVYALSLGRSDIIKTLIAKGVADAHHLSDAISLGRSDIVHDLIEGGVIPDLDHLLYAKKMRKQDIVDYLTERIQSPRK